MLQDLENTLGSWDMYGQDDKQRYNSLQVIVPFSHSIMPGLRLALLLHEQLCRQHAESPAPHSSPKYRVARLFIRASAGQLNSGSGPVAACPAPFSSLRVPPEGAHMYHSGKLLKAS